MNAEKCQFSQRKIKFLGHVIDERGMQSDPEKISAIVELDPPRNVTKLRRFMRMANQLSKFSPHLAELSEPLRELLSSK